MSDERVYDQIGIGYTKHRRADSRLVDAIVAQLGLEAGAIVADIGSGTGNYAVALAERGFWVKAIEPSDVMRRQALQHPRVEWLPGVAEAIPLESGSVDGVVCVLAFHHFGAARQAAREMRRISKGPIVVFTFDPRPSESFWLEDYFPEIFAEAKTLFPPAAEVGLLFEESRSSVTAWELPHDLHDMFLAAGWRRPEIYLDAQVRACMSGFALADDALVASRIAQLEADLRSGAWRERYGAVLTRDRFDAGYRFVRAR